MGGKKTVNPNATAFDLPSRNRALERRMSYAAHATKQEHEATFSPKGWKALTDDRKVAVLVDIDDGGRMEHAGGYTTEYVITDGIVYWATLDAGKEYQRAELVVATVAAFIRDRESCVTDNWD